MGNVRITSYWGAFA